MRIVMSGVSMMIIAIVVLGGGYLLYGRWLAKTWGIDPDAKTPTYKLQDGVDYEPADTAIIFGHQFASIAGAGPINGPIQAAVFGWVPVLIWILVVAAFALTSCACPFLTHRGRGMWLISKASMFNNIPPLLIRS